MMKDVDPVRFSERLTAYKEAKALVMSFAETVPPETYSDVVEGAPAFSSPVRETTTALDQVVFHSMHLAEWLLEIGY